MSVQDKLADFVHLSNEEFEKEYKKDYNSKGMILL